MKMELEIESREENKTLGREEIVLRAEHEGEKRPSRREVRELINAKYGFKNYVVISIRGRYGQAKSRIRVHLYKTLEQMKKLEHKYVLKRNGLGNGEEKKESGDQGQAQASEAPAQ